MIILNDRLMSETVQSEHSYFNHLDDDSRDGDISDTHSSTFKGECVLRNVTTQAADSRQPHSHYGGERIAVQP